MKFEPILNWLEASLKIKGVKISQNSDHVVCTRPLTDIIFILISGDRQKGLKCGEGSKSGITHTNAEEKNEVVLNWEIPNPKPESVIVRATVVYKYDAGDRIRITYEI